MALTDSLVSYWKLDESSGNAADSVASNTLTNNNSTAYASAKINNGADFEASSSNSLSITDAAQSGLDLATDFSIAFWFKPESISATHAFVSKRGGGNGYSIYFENDIGAGVKGFSTDMQATSGTIAKTLSNGTFYYLAFVYTKAAGTLDVYVDGSLHGQIASLTTALAGSTADFYMGSEVAGAIRFLDGIMDEVGVWARVLTSGEITSLYNSGSGLSYPFTAASGPANLKSYNTNVKANIKSIDTNVIANVKSLDTNV